MIEIILVIAIVGVLATIGLWTSMDSYRGYSYRSERDNLVSALQKARMDSMTNINAAQHGVHLTASNYTVFQGTDYASRNPSFDRVITPSGAITLSGSPALPRDVVFDQLSGSVAAAMAGTITITDGARSTAITINNEGHISW